jgi:hypothetical protein
MAKKILTGASPKATNASSMIEYKVKPLELDTWECLCSAHRTAQRHLGRLLVYLFP